MGEATVKPDVLRKACYEGQAYQNEPNTYYAFDIEASYLPKVDRDDSHHDSSPIKGGRGLRF
jgi:hypothetical protein